MLVVALLVLELVLVVAGPVAVAAWVAHRLGARWAHFGWGALAFIGAQAVRMPLLIALTAAARGWDPGEEVAFWLNLVVLCLTAGLFEETARWLLLRYGARDARAARDGVMFGLGHGGVEAVLLVGVTVLNTLVLLLAGDLILAQVAAQAPEAIAPVEAAIEQVRGLRWWEPLLATWERVVAVALHVALTLLVLRTARGGNPAGWLLAVLLHAAVNAAALIALRHGGVLAASGAVTLVAIAPIALAARWWPRGGPDAAVTPGG